jgi:hypothetical protein
MIDRKYFLRFWLLLLALFASGCAVPYAYPRVDKTEAIPVSERDVTAIRVDYTAAGDERWEREASEYRIALVPIDPKQSQIPEQSRVGLERGLYLYMFHLAHNNKVSEYVEVRLYRRGSRTVRLNNSYQGGPLLWVPTKTLLDREDAIDTMFSPDVAGTATTGPADAPPLELTAEEVFRFTLFTPLGTEPFRQACAFGAREYAVLKVDPALPAADRERIEIKESYLRKLASTR